MKLRIFTLAFFMAGAVVFGQKKEIRQAQKAVENEDFEEAKSLLAEVEGDVSSLNKRFKGMYYLAKGNTLLGLNAEDGNLDDLKEAAESFKKAADNGEKDEADQGLGNVVGALINSGVNDQNSQNYKDAYKKMYAAYDMNPTDTIYLFAAAGNAFNAQDDEQALEYYTKLKDMGYRGDGIQYLATQKETGEEQSFGDEKERDLFVKTGEYENPREVQEDRRDGDIIKQLAVLYLRNDKKDEALKAIEEAKQADPDDVEMMKAEAMIYQEMGDEDKYLELIDNLIQQDPDDAATYYKILGDGAYTKKEYEEAKKYYQKSVDEDPEMGDSYNGIASSILAKQEDVVEEMNELGMSDADQKKYDELQEERKSLLEEALPYMEKALEYDEDNINILRTLYQINSQLRNEDDANKYKKLMDEKAAG